jgi:hypothetical protein
MMPRFKSENADSTVLVETMKPSWYRTYSSALWLTAFRLDRFVLGRPD